jgi:UDP-3-O-[3-hydroxymyristoyl] glucosamine N-acyltransferase
LTNGIRIGKNARVNIGSVVIKDVEENQSVYGNYAIEYSKFIENLKKNR